MNRYPASLLLLISLFAGCGDRGADQDRAKQVRELVDEREYLRQQLEQRISSELMLSNPTKPEGNVAIGIDAEFLAATIATAAERYLARVELDLSGKVRVLKEGDVSVKMLIANPNAGHWKLAISFPHLVGVLRAGAATITPREGQLGIVIPVRLTEGEGRAELDLSWNANLITSAICGDFRHRITVEGQVIPTDYELHGRLLLETTHEGLMIRSALDDPLIRLGVDVSEAAYSQVREVVAKQSESQSCGMVLDESTAEAKLRDLVRRGFRARLPRELEHSVRLPTSYASQVEVFGRSLAIGVETSPPSLDADALWSRGNVKVKPPPTQ